MSTLAIWSTIEPGLGITAACLATLRPLLRTLTKALIALRSSENRTSNRDIAEDEAHRPRSPDPLEKLDAKKPSFSGAGVSFATQGSDQSDDVDVADVAHNYKSWPDLLATRTPNVNDPMAHKIKKASWWRPPSFNAGLMTEIRHAVRDVQTEEQTRSATRLTHDDAELAGSKLDSSRARRSDQAVIPRYENIGEA
jgi:hypothetical protein